MSRIAALVVPCLGPLVAIGALLPGQSPTQWNWLRMRVPFGTGPIAFDEARGRVVLFGGNANNSSGALADTWLWDGAAWTQANTATHPDARTRAAFAFDRARGLGVLVGGERTSSGPRLSDTWTWDGAQWSRVATQTAPVGFEAAMAFDDARGLLVLNVWDLNASFVSTVSTFEWTGSDWLQLATAAPAELWRMAYDANRGRVVQHVGQGGLSEWNGSTWIPVAGGAPTVWTGMTSDYVAGAATAFGLGQDGFETWLFRGERWQRMQPALSPTSHGGMLAADPFAGRTVLFGGTIDGFTRLDETWEWNGTNWRQVTTALRPPARMYGGLGFQASPPRMILFGGIVNGQRVVNDTWSYDGLTWAQMQPAASPSARRGFGIASDPLRNRVVLFGGLDGGSTTRLGDTWEWDGGNWSLHASSGPSPRFWPAMDYDLLRGSILLFGDYSALGDTWEWDGISWRVLATGTAATANQGFMAQAGASAAHVLADSTGVTWLLRPGGPATAAVWGTACGTPGQLLEHRSDLPYLGNADFALEVRNAQPGAPCLVALSGAQQTVTLGGGCISYLAQPFSDVFFAIANSAGIAQVRLPIPNATFLLGVGAFTQAAALDPQGPLGGVAVANAMQLTIGR